MSEDTNMADLIQQGDIGSFEALYDKYSSALLSFSYNYIRNRSMVEDVVQDSFLAIWQQRERLPEDVNIQNYLFTIVRNKSIARLREMIKARNKSIDELTQTDFFLQRKLSSLEDMESSIIDVENIKRTIDDIFESLPPIYQEVFSLSRHQNMSYNDIALELGISVKAVEKRMTKVLKIFRDRLRENYSLLFIL